IELDVSSMMPTRSGRSVCCWKRRTFSGCMWLSKRPKSESLRPLMKWPFLSVTVKTRSTSLTPTVMVFVAASSELAGAAVCAAGCDEDGGCEAGAAGLAGGAAAGAVWARTQTADANKTASRPTVRTRMRPGWTAAPGLSKLASFINITRSILSIARPEFAPEKPATPGAVERWSTAACRCVDARTPGARRGESCARDGDLGKLPARIQPRRTSQLGACQPSLLDAVWSGCVWQTTNRFAM